MKTQILRSSTVVTAKDQVWCEMAGEAVILNLKSGIYYGLNPVGARVWSLIQEPKSVGNVLDTLLAEYDVEPDRCESDLMALLQDLAARELIKIEPETNGAVK
ncbi:MAG TPA: PqqD family protein [Methylomirabilota bacterium]|nr:PqqD family protein [Methylomirabilota bacterium]